MHRGKLEDGRKCNFGVNLNQESFNKEIETVILNLTKNEGLRQYIEKKMDEKVDVSRLENELDQTKENIKQSRAAKDRLLDYMEQLDQNDRHYNKKRKICRRDWMRYIRRLVN